jgi:hypothetical protein
MVLYDEFDGFTYLDVSTPEQNRASRRRESAPFDWNWPD